MTSNALEVYAKIGDPIEAAVQMGQFIAKSQLVPCQNAEAGAVIALTCMQQGITPLDFSRTYHIIKGKVTMQAKAMLVEFRRRGGKHKIVEYSPDKVEIVFTFEGDEQTFSITWEEAKASRWPWKNPDNHNEGLKDNWSTPTDRKRMLFARLLSESMSLICPEINYGFSTPEEMSDVMDEPIPTVEQAGVVEPALFGASGEMVVEAEDVKTVEPLPNVALDACMDWQIQKIDELLDKAGMNVDQRATMLSKRDVARVGELTKDQADEIIDKLTAAIQAKS